MKRYYIYYSLIFFLGYLFIGCDTSETISPKSTDTFIRLFGGQFQDKGVAIATLPDNRLAILGSTTQSPVITGEDPIKDIVIIVTDTTGTDAELYTLGDVEANESPSGMVYYDGNLYIGGTTDINGDNDFLFLNLRHLRLCAEVFVKSNSFYKLRSGIIKYS